jgi:hypothetical protein
MFHGHGHHGHGGRWWHGHWYGYGVAPVGGGPPLAIFGFVVTEQWSKKGVGFGRRPFPSHGSEKDFANGIANEPRGTARHRTQQGGIMGLKLANWSTRLGTDRHASA